MIAGEVAPDVWGGKAPAVRRLGCGVNVPTLVAMELRAEGAGVDVFLSCDEARQLAAELLAAAGQDP